MSANAEYPLFPPGFLLGAATASYQIEGAVRDDGRGESIWDRFSHTPGKTYQGQTGDVACDHYHLWRQDLDLMASLRLRAYRFSIAWPRIMPTGRPPVNPAGLDFYDRLVDGLLERGIEPFVTLYHWDLPQALQDAGGWASPAVVEPFADYAAAVARRLGDRVRRWMTINEPWVAAFIGHLTGDHAPGLTDLATGLLATHHMLLAHGRAAAAIRAAAPSRPEVGIVLNLNHIDPASDSEEDVDAARRHDGYLNRLYLDPLFKGRYPGDAAELFGDPARVLASDEVTGLPRTVDFLGINNYSRSVIGHRPGGFLDVTHHRPAGSRYTEMDWEVYPEGLYKVLTRVHRDYQPGSLYVTENGAAFADRLQPDGTVDDADRVAYFRDHTFAVHRALTEGVPLKGYFAWSLLDNFEWAQGYTKRFGIVYVDYATLERTVKQSGHWFRALIEAQP